MQEQVIEIITKEGTGRKKEAWLEVLRVSAAFAVVMLHTLTGAEQAADQALYRRGAGELVLMDLVSWCVPVFLMISGYLFLNPKRKLPFKTMLTRYCGRIVLALFLFGVPYACLEQIADTGGFRFQMIGEAFAMVLRQESWAHMWYLYLIFYLYLITPPLKKVLEILPRRIVVLAAGVLLMLGSIFPFLNIMLVTDLLPKLPAWTIYFFYYVCGYLIATGTWRSDRPSIALLCAVCAVCAGMILSRLSGNYQLQMAYHYPPAVLLSVLLMYLARINDKLCSRIVGRKWEAVSAMSFTIYLIHPVFLNIFYKFLHITPLDYPMWVSLPVFFTAAMLLSVLGAWILRQIRVLRRYVLG